MTVSRRKFLKASIGLSATPWLFSADQNQTDPLAETHVPFTGGKGGQGNLYEDLLFRWSEALLDLQVKEIDMPQVKGGILCPAGARIRGRCFVGILPFLYMADRRKDSSFLEGAIQLQNWSDHVSLPDGSWVNEPITSGWRATTVFSFIAMAESLIHFGHLLENADREKWMDRSRKAAEWVYANITFSFNSNINYPVSTSFAMALAGVLFDDSKYTERARHLARGSLEYFTPENKILFGEGKPRDRRSPKGCYPVDLGYNVEESLPSLVLYAKMLNDEEVLETVITSLKTHLEFMLPDGAWDNSWGTRNFKWTYWGSRTTDGCQVAYGLLADKDPAFAEAAYRNLQLLDQCTHDGILYGGPHLKVHGADPSIHHTFCHAKALATCLMMGVTIPDESAPLPREKEDKIKHYSEIDTWLISKGGWKATITGYDWTFLKNDHASGGAISMLWHAKVGPILSASLSNYVMYEKDNMQPMYEKNSMALTPRIEAVVDGRIFDNINDLSAEISKIDNPIDNPQATTLKSTGNLVDHDYQIPDSGPIVFEILYDFHVDGVSITVGVDHQIGVDEVRFVLPVISNHLEMVEADERAVTIKKDQADVTIASTNPAGLPENHERTFNFVPGFEALPLTYKLAGGKPLNVKIQVL